MVGWSRSLGRPARRVIGRIGVARSSPAMATSRTFFSCLPELYDLLIMRRGRTHQRLGKFVVDTMIGALSDERPWVASDTD